MFTLKQVADEVTLMERYTYRTATTLQLKPNGSYFLKLEFVDMSPQQMEELQYIGKARQVISIRSTAIPEEAGVNRIVVAARLKSDGGALVWRCHCYKSLQS
jgi:hypothetical protein